MVSIKDCIEATLNGIAQIAFSNKPVYGIIIFISILFISPMSALGAIIGVSLSSLISYNYYKKSYYSKWKKGYFSYSSGVLGIIIGSYLFYSPIYFLTYITSIIFCTLLDIVLKHFFFNYKLPTFALSAIITCWLVYLILLYNKYPFWISIGTFPFNKWSTYICIIGILSALFLNNKKATITTIAFTVTGIIFCRLILNLSFYESAGLWAFNIATISYISSIIFLPLGLFGILLVFISILLSSIIWLIWIYSEFWQVLPVLITPFTVSILILIFISNKIFGPIIYSSNLWSIVDLIKKNKNICVLSGAGVSTPSGIPDYVSGEWLDKKHDIKDYDFTHFLKSRNSRKIYWDVCYKFYTNCKKTKYNIIHETLCKLEKSKKISSVITQNVDGFHQFAGSKKVIELHGNISKTSCIHCKKKYQWEKINQEWLKRDVKCSECLDLIKPSVIAMEQDLDPLVWSKAKRSVKEAKLLLILGTQLSISSAIGLLEIARNNKTKIIIINNTPVAINLKKEEEILYYPLEKFFQILSLIKLKK
jgi:NAD-dependent deacetylase